MAQSEWQPEGAGARENSATPGSSQSNSQREGTPCEKRGKRAANAAATVVSFQGFDQGTTSDFKTRASASPLFFSVAEQLEQITSMTVVVVCTKPKLTRTIKLCAALCITPLVVTEAWFKACLLAGVPVDCRQHLLSGDFQASAPKGTLPRWSFNASQSLQKASCLRASGGCLSGLQFFVDGSHADPKALVLLIRSAGGTVAQGIIACTFVVSNAGEDKVRRQNGCKTVKVISPEMLFTCTLQQRAPDY